MLGVGFSIQFGMGVYYVYARELATPAEAATSFTVFTTISFGGMLIAPSLGGWLVDTFSREVAFLFHIGIGLFGIALLFLTPDSKPVEFD